MALGLDEDHEAIPRDRERIPDGATYRPELGKICCEVIAADHRQEGAIARLREARRLEWCDPAQVASGQLR